jgi:Rrf2 family iron-sulfur cluster assembly transcriptional regulator
MKLSSKSRYAVKSMLQLALVKDGGSVPLMQITAEQGLSQSYLEQLFAALRARNLIKGMRGPGGGYQLSRPASEINIADVVDAVDESAFSRPARPMLSYLDDERYQFNAMWTDLSDLWREFLSTITLQELIDNHDKRREFLHHRFADKAA